MAKKYFNVDVETSGNMSAVDVTASGNMSAVDVTASGNMSAVGITASGNMSAIDITASGNMSAVDVTSSGQLNTNKVSARTGDEVLITNDPDTDTAQKIGVVVNDSPETTAFLTLAEGDNEDTGGGARFIYAGNAAYLGGVTAANKGAIQAIDIVSSAEHKNNILEFHKDGSQVRLNSTGAITLTGGTAGSGDVIVQGQFECAYSATVEDNLTVNGALTCGTLTGTGTQIKSTTDLILTCDSDNGDTTSEIKFCKNSDNAEVANIDQYGRMELQGLTIADENSSLATVGVYKSTIQGYDRKKSEPNPTTMYSLSAETGNLSLEGTLTAYGPTVLANTVASNGDFTFNNSGTVTVNTICTFSDDVFMTALPTLEATTGDQYYVGIEAASNNSTSLGINQLGKVAESGYFTQGHSYLSDVELPPGTSVILQPDGSVVPSSEANSTIVVGIVIRCVDTEESLLKATSLSPLGGETAFAYYVRVASVGDSRHRELQGFNVCNENGDIQPGDLLVTSSTPGYLMKQDDDIIRSKTVGKAMEAVTFDANGQATGIYGYIYCG